MATEKKISAAVRPFTVMWLADSHWPSRRDEGADRPQGVTGRLP